MAAAVASQARPLTRREFLIYVWSASMALTLAGSAGAVLWYAYPRFREGEFGGEFPIAASTIPSIDVAPEPHTDGRFWLINTERGVLALYMVCTHLGCLYKWTPSANRFECPCHGSKYTREGVKIEGPTPRNLDRFVIRALDAEDNIIAETDDAGAPVAIPDAAVTIRIATAEKIKGAAARV